MKFPSINQFPAVMKDVKWFKDRIKDDAILEGFKNVKFNASIKLHGTNACIGFEVDNGEVVTNSRVVSNVWAQKRTQVMTSSNDNFGFARWVEEVIEPRIIGKEVYSRMWASGVFRLYGEWAGPAVQKGVSISDIPQKSFFPFAYSWSLKVDSPPEEVAWHYFVDDPVGVDILRDILRGFRIEDVDNIYSLGKFKTYTVDMTSSESVGKFANEVSADVDLIDAIDPYVKDKFGIEGHGEGLVLQAKIFVGHEFAAGNGPGVDAGVKTFRFKAKGESHSVTKVKKAVTVDFLKATKIDEFIDFTVTENRVKQGIQETGAEDIKGISDVIRWVVADVEKECMDDLGDLQWEDVKKKLGGVIALKAKPILNNWEV